MDRVGTGFRPMQAEQSPAQQFSARCGRNRRSLDGFETHPHTNAIIVTLWLLLLIPYPAPTNVTFPCTSFSRRAECFRALIPRTNFAGDSCRWHKPSNWPLRNGVT